MTAEFKRYAVYVVPEGAFYETGAAWLGWDSATGREAPHPDVSDLPAPLETLTETPRKYGFHGTIKPPFRLAEGTDRGGLEAALERLTQALAPAEVSGLGVRPHNGFVACVPERPIDALAEMAASVVKGLDGFRAPPDEAELARRRKSGLSAGQETNLQAWGYPHVLDEFRFHLTLSGKLPPPQAEALAGILAEHFAPVLPRPFRVASLGFLGEAQNGRFHLIHRYPLSG